jgi:hypothetical protein
MSDTTQQVADDLRLNMEFHAGLVLTGPDAPSVGYSFDKQNHYTINYLKVALGGFSGPDELKAQALRFVMAREFIVHGNPVRLQRVWTQQAPGQFTAPVSETYPQGIILVWREGCVPAVELDEDTWSVEMTYCLLPPFAHVEDATR